MGEWVKGKRGREREGLVGEWVEGKGEGEKGEHNWRKSDQPVERKLLLFFLFTRRRRVR